ncbi:hypothetical protein [Mucilaginibacter ginkgonis]|uniref:Uncharacterized protein n=1 Tax=Mucilaginibacter ginkgonis TaxID=2682091 RepID=A0A6I4I035_9SPHI|nr:hypothetical protein [Mucilaginibacter ginkgonis]QQL48951.1 hypothetical protein GO620_012280 [Mucilaginibacter ginkgonis]
MITFCDLWEDSAYEFTLRWDGDALAGDHWALVHDHVWYMGCFILYNGV